MMDDGLYYVLYFIRSLAIGTEQNLTMVAGLSLGPSH